MLRYKLNYIIFLLFISCNNSTSSGNGISANTANAAVKINLPDTSGFLSDCQKIEKNISSGYLQGVEIEKDSLGLFGFYECFDCKETYEIVFVHKDFNIRKQLENDSVWRALQAGCRDYFKDFESFAFVYRMRDPDKQIHMHELNMDFPLVVRIYERIADDKWKFIMTAIVKTFSEFGFLQFKSIYHLR